ncbi:hypothetical protein C8J56DRAFT_879936 [Mycena floridula]|nr:hypothetical protein C8J56DRAFT_879936 [Mycena floridula]
MLFSTTTYALLVTLAAGVNAAPVVESNILVARAEGGLGPIIDQFSATPVGTPTGPTPTGNARKPNSRKPRSWDDDALVARAVGDSVYVPTSIPGRPAPTANARSRKPNSRKPRNWDDDALVARAVGGLGDIIDQFPTSVPGPPAPTANARSRKPKSRKPW